MKTRKFLAAGYEIRLRDYGIATVDRFCLVTDHLHRDRSRHARALKVSHRTPSQVMRHDARHADLAASCPPRSVEVFDRISLITEEDRPGNGTVERRGLLPLTSGPPGVHGGGSRLRGGLAALLAAVNLPAVSDGS